MNPDPRYIDSEREFRSGNNCENQAGLDFPMLGFLIKKEEGTYMKDKAK